MRHPLFVIFLRCTGSIDPFVDQTPHIVFFTLLDKDTIIPETAFDKSLRTKVFAVFLLKIELRDRVASNYDA